MEQDSRKVNQIRRDLCIAEIYLEEAEVQEFPGFGVTSFALAHVDGWRVILKTTTRKQKTDWINIIQSLKIVHSPKSAAKKPKILALSKVKLELLRKSHTHQYLKLDKKDYTITKNMQPSSVFYSIRERTMSNGSLGINISTEVTKQHSLPLYERRRLKTYSKFSENGPTLREMIKKCLLTDEWYHWSNLLQEENISGMSDLEKRQQIMMLQFIIYEVAINIDLAELVNLAKQSITWNSSLVSYNKRTIASCLDKMKQTSESLLAEFDELWKTKKNLIKVLYIYQKYMDRYDSYITYMSYFNDFQSVLHEAIEYDFHSEV